MRRIKKKWESPRHPWERRRLIEERKLLVEYGLKNKRELWRMKFILTKIRKWARQLISIRHTEYGQKEIEKLLNRLYKMGLVDEKTVKERRLEDVLAITLRDILDRRLQTLVFKKGLARTPKQARQLIVHRHIMVGDRVVSAPSYLVKRDEENSIRYRDPSLREAIWGSPKAEAQAQGE